jgi:hypothetical protein
MTEATKICKTCGQTKTVSAFWRANNTKDGLENSCKDCRNFKTPPELMKKHATQVPKVVAEHIIMPWEIVPPNPYHVYLPKTVARVQDKRLSCRCISCQALIAPEVGNPTQNGVYHLKCPACKKSLIAIPVMAVA